MIFHISPVSSISSTMAEPPPPSLIESVNRDSRKCKLQAEMKDVEEVQPRTKLRIMGPGFQEGNLPDRGDMLLNARWVPAQPVSALRAPMAEPTTSAIPSKIYVSVPDVNLIRGDLSAVYTPTKIHGNQGSIRNASGSKSGSD